MNRFLMSARAYLLPLILPLLFASGQQPQERPPNVVLIVADQMRGDAISALGHPDIQTPNLDRMAEGGVIFPNFFTTNPVCTPTRMSLWSGLFPHEHGALSNKGVNKLATEENTMLGHFKKRGYRIGWFGKDNHGYDREVLDRVLDANTSRKREPYRAYTATTSPYWHSNKPWPMEKTYPTLTTTDAIDFIREDDDRPFFTMLSLFDPHPPYFAPAEYTRKYLGKQLTLPEPIDPSAIDERLARFKRAMLHDLIGSADYHSMLATYYAAIEFGVDHQIGRVLDALEELDIADETIVVMTSDHGDFSGEYGMIRKGAYLLDALLHVPNLWWAPGRIEAGHQTKAVTSTVDIFPTLVELTGGDAESGMSGRSLVPFLEGQTDYDPNFAVIASSGYTELPDDYFDNPEPPFWDPGEITRPFHTRIYDRTTPNTSRTIMARTHDWKLIISETRPDQLFFMDGGWTERENLASDPAHREILARLRGVVEVEWEWE